MSRPDGLEFKTLAVANPAEPDTRGVIEALVAVTGVKDEVGDIIEPGAFRRTLGERPKPKVCLGHDWNRPIGKSLEVVELMPGDRRLPKMTADGRPWPREAGALRARWQANLDSEDGKAAYSNAKFFGPEESTFSIGYRTTRARQRGSTRHIQDLDLFEYGPVLNPANRLATLQSIKSGPGLTNPVDSERQDFETGDGDVEAKTKYVRDADYWGKPIGTPITPGMKPRGGNDREHGTSEKPERTGSFFSSLPSDEQAVARALPTNQRIKYLDARAAGKDHEEALAATGRTVNEQAEDEKYRRSVAGPSGKPEQEPDAKPARDDVPQDVQDRIDAARRDGRDDQAAKIYSEYLRSKKPQKPATPRKPAGPKKPTVKQKALLFDARPGRIMTYRRDENGNRIYAGPFPSKEGLIFRGHANSAFPMEKAGWVEAGYDGRHYILTPEGERLRAQLESEDSERQTQLREERRVAALGPDTAQAADANVDASAAPMDMTPTQFADAEMAAQARRKRAVNIADEEETARKENSFRIAADQAAVLAPGAIDRRLIEHNPKAELAGTDRLVLTGAGTKNWSLNTVDGLAVVRSIDFNELSAGGDRRKPLGKTQLRDLANRLAGIRDAEGRPVPFDYPNPDPDKTSPDWVRGWRDATGTDLQGAMAEVVAQWAEDNDLTYRRADLLKRRKVTNTVPGGAPDSAGFRARKAEELAPGDQVRLPDGSVGTVERSGADAWNSAWTDAKKIEGQVLLTDGRTISVNELGGIEKTETPKPPPGANLSDYEVARRRGGSGGKPPREIVIPIKFAEDADGPDAGHDPGMGSIPATSAPPGGIVDPRQLVSSNYVDSIRKSYEPLPAGTRVVQNERQPGDRFLPEDIRAKVGTMLPLVQEFNGETYQTVRFDDGTYSQLRVRGVRGDLGSEGAFEVDPSPERVDQVRRERGLSPTGEATPLTREVAPEPVAEPTVAEVSTPGETVQEVSTSVTPEAAPATPPRLTATETLPEQQTLPYEVIKKPNRSGKGARVRFNGREYNVDATSGVLAEVTVTDDDGHSATVAGGSSTMLRREMFADRERALRQALTETEAQHNAEPEARSEPEAEAPAPEPEPPASAPRPARAGAAKADQEAVLAALDNTAAANLSTRPGYASPSESAARIAEAVRTGDRKIATSPAAPSGLYMLSPPSHMAKGGYSWELQSTAGSRIPMEIVFGASSDSRLNVERFAPKSGKRSSLLLEAIGETVKDADGNPPPFDSLDTSWSREWRDANGLNVAQSMKRFAVPAYLRKMGENERADDYERAQEPLPNQPEPAAVPEVPEDVPEPETATVPIEQLDEAATLQDEVLGITEQPDGTIEVTEEVAARQDRVAALIEQDDAGTFNLGDKSDQELTTTRDDLSEELKLQSVLATRQATPKAEILKSPAGAAEKPPQRPGLAGAAEDYSEALQSGDAEAITRTRARLESSLRRSRAGSESARALADHVTGEGDDDAEALTAFAQRMRRESREKRNAAAVRRRTARRLERVRIQSLIDKIDSELQTRARSTEPQQTAQTAPTGQFVPEYVKRYGGMSDAELEAAKLDARQRAATDSSAQNDLIMIRKEQDRRESLNQDVAKAPPANRPKANADRPREERAERVTHKPGDRVQSEYGRGTVVEQTGRSLRYRLDSGEELNVVVGTPGYDRVRPINEVDTPVVSAALSDAEYTAHTQRVEAALNAAFAAGQTTDKVHTVNGEGAVWLPERAQAHKDIIDALWTKAANVPRDGEALIAGGLGGAGKSTVLRGGAGVDQSRFLTINPDDVKEEMVRRGLVPAVEGLSPMEASPIVHEESSHIANMLAKRAYAERVNVIWDITMSRQASVAKRIDELRAAGYDTVDAVFVDIPVETSVERALGRHRRGMERFRAGEGAGGRYVPPSLIRANASSTASSANREVFNGLRERFDNWVVFDNSVVGRDPVKVEGAGHWANAPELTNRVESTNVVTMNEEWAGKNWRQTLRDLPVEQRRQIQDAVGTHRYKAYADARAKGEDHDAALRAATGEDENGPSLYAGNQSLERIAAERDGIDPKIGRLRSADLFNELAYRKQRLATGRKPLAFENVDSESYRKRITDLELPVTILTALVEQERALVSGSRASNDAFTDNPTKMSPARLRVQMFALERSRNALDQKRLAQLRRAADKRGISPIAGQLERTP